MACDFKCWMTFLFWIFLYSHTAVILDAKGTIDYYVLLIFYLDNADCFLHCIVLSCIMYSKYNLIALFVEIS